MRHILSIRHHPRRRIARRLSPRHRKLPPLLAHPTFRVVSETRKFPSQHQPRPAKRPQAPARANKSPPDARIPNRSKSIVATTASNQSLPPVPHAAANRNGRNTAPRSHPNRRPKTRASNAPAKRSTSPCSFRFPRKSDCPKIAPAQTHNQPRCIPPAAPSPPPAAASTHSAFTHACPMFPGFVAPAIDGRLPATATAVSARQKLPLPQRKMRQLVDPNEKIFRRPDIGRRRSHSRNIQTASSSRSTTRPGASIPKSFYTQIAARPAGNIAAATLPIPDTSAAATAYSLRGNRAPARSLPSAAPWSSPAPPLRQINDTSPAKDEISAASETPCNSAPGPRSL